MGSCTSVLCTVHLAAIKESWALGWSLGKKAVIVRSPLNGGSVHTGSEYPAIALRFSITLVLGTVNLNLTYFLHPQ